MPAATIVAVDEDRRAGGQRLPPGRDRAVRPGEVVEDRRVAGGVGQTQRQRPQLAREAREIGFRRDQRERAARRSPPGRGDRCSVGIRVALVRAKRSAAPSPASREERGRRLRRG